MGGLMRVFNGSPRRNRRLHAILALLVCIFLISFYIIISPNFTLSSPSNTMISPLQNKQDDYDYESESEDFVQEDDKVLHRSVQNRLKEKLQKRIPNLPEVHEDIPDLADSALLNRFMKFLQNEFDNLPVVSSDGKDQSTILTELSMASLNPPVATKKVDDPAKTKQDLLDRLQNEIPYLPVNYIEKHKSKNMYSRADCARLPKMSAIEFSNNNWQNFFTPSRIFQFFSAYYDNRPTSDTPAVRIISMTNNIHPEGNFCQFWFENLEKPIIVKVKAYLLMWRVEWKYNIPGSYHPYLITCQLPKNKTQIPSAVSIVANQCDNATNLLKVNYDHVEPKKDFVVCVKGLDFPDTDISVRLVEWIELLTLLGNDMIYFYNLQLHPNVMKLLNYYERQNRVRVVPMSLAGAQPNHPILQHAFLKDNLKSKRHNEMVVYNDCFYRNMNTYKYVAIIDIDEVIMPVGNLTSWQQLIAAAEREDFRKNKKIHSAYFAKNVYFLDNHLHQHSWTKDIPKSLHMLQHVYRSANSTIPETFFVKSFYNTELVLIVHNHLPIACINATWCYYPIPLELGQMQHYRSGCEPSIKKAQCQQLMESSVQDDNIWKYKHDLIERSLSTLIDLGYSSEYLEYP